MKKLIFAAVFIAVIAAGSPVFAQSIPPDRESEYYYINITLDKIFPYRAGYVVEYSRGILHNGRAYLPLEWFSAAASRGEIITLPRGPAWPSMSVYYKEGEFSHVRLYVHRWVSHQTWGTIPQSVNLDGHFDNLEDLALTFR